MRAPSIIETMGILMFIVLPLGLIGAFGVMSVILWAISDMIYYGLLMFALGVGLGAILRWPTNG